MAQIRGKPVYKITDVALIPLASQSDADQAITTAREHLRRLNKTTGTDHGSESGSESESEEGAPSVTDSLLEEETGAQAAEVKDAVTGQRGKAQPGTSVAEDVIQRKGVYGRFADKWFSRKGWSADSRRVQGLTSDEDLRQNTISPPKNASGEGASQFGQVTAGASKPDAIPTDDKTVPEPVKPEEIPKALGGEKDATTIALLPKILQTTRMYFASGNFFFSYDYDISHGIGTQRPNSSLPLHRQFDPLVGHSVSTLCSPAS